MESRKHRSLAERLAQIKGVDYHSNKGIDIRTAQQAIEVEVKPDAIGEAIKQLSGTNKTPYLAVPKDILEIALKAVEGKRFGVMGPNGKIFKTGRRRMP